MPRPKTYDDDLERRLIARAAAVIAEAGPMGLTLRPVAAAEGTSTTAVYSIFGGRSGLIAAVGASARESFVAAQREVPVTDDPYQDLVNLGRAYRAWAKAHPAEYAVLMMPALPETRLDGPIDQSLAAEPLREAVRRLIDNGTFPALPADAVLVPIWAAVHGFVALELGYVFEGVPPEELTAMYEAQLAVIGAGWRSLAQDSGGAVPTGAGPGWDAAAS